MVKVEPLFGSDAAPLVIEAGPGGEGTVSSLMDWVATERAWMVTTLHVHGALLLRGFALNSLADFEGITRSFAPRLKRYVGGESPRTALSEGVYTSTEYPAHLEIALHSEMSYARCSPQWLFFFCLQPASNGGETPIADGRQILAAMDPEVATRFERRQVMYLNNYHTGWGFGKSWQETFETTHREQVEQILEAEEVEFRWSDDGLWTRAIRPAVVRHGVSGERVWFNQADRWHVSARGAEAAGKLLRLMGEDGLPRHARFGDGSAIPSSDLDGVRDAYRSAEHRFPWQRGDLLLLDNHLMAHGRRPFTGERRVVVAMA